PRSGGLLSAQALRAPAGRPGATGRWWCRCRRRGSRRGGSPCPARNRPGRRDGSPSPGCPTSRPPCTPGCPGPAPPGPSPRVCPGGLAGIPVVEPVAAPLPDVAVHVVQAPGVGQVRADRGRAAEVRPLGRAAVRLVPVKVGLDGRQALPVVEKPPEVEGEVEG